MGYEIPQEIEYKEIIIFGLNWKQLLIGAFMLIPAFFIIVRDFYNYYNYIIAAPLIILGLGFMFLDLDKKIKSFIDYQKFKNVENNSLKMKLFLNIKDVKEDSLFLRKFFVCNKLSIVSIEPVNVLMKGEDERDAISYGFEKFLNSFDFPTQFLITSTEENQIFYKKFYIVIPEKYDLNIQIGLVIKEIKSLGLQAKRLNSYEIVELFNNYFPTSPKKEEVSLEELKKDFVHYLISPSKIENNKDFLFFDNFFSRTISVIGYPRTVNFGFLDKIIKIQNNVTISIHVEPFSIERLTVKLHRELQKQRADLYSISQKGSTNPVLEIKHSDTRKVLEDLQKGEEKLFLISFYVLCKAKSKEELDKLSQTVITELNSILMIPKVPNYLQAQALKSCLPFCQNTLDCKRNITTKPLSAFFPFTSKFYNQDFEGIHFGINENKSPIIKNIFLLPNHNGLILATSGSGKSYLTKLLIQRYKKQAKTKLFIIDPEGEYSAIVQKLGGQVINIGLSENNVINPLDLMGHDLKNKKLSLIELFKLMFPDLSNYQFSILDQAVNHVYNEIPNPVIKDIYDYLEKEKLKSKAIYDIQTYSVLIHRLGLYAVGSFSFLNNNTNIKVDNDLVCFHLNNLPSILEPVLTYLIMDFLYNQMKSVEGKKLLFIDEAWTVLTKANEHSLLFRIIKTCRKHNMGVFLITQETEDLVNNKAGKSILTNSSTNILLRQKPNVVRQLKEVFNLNQEETYILLNSGIGKGIMIFDNEREQATITTNDEEHEINELKTNKKQVITIVPDNKYNKFYYFYNELKEPEKLYLMDKGYMMCDCIPLNKIRSQKVLVKKLSRESPQHTFYVHHIADYLRQFTDKICTYESVNPDIVFELNNEKHALEIETGINLENHKNRVKEKSERLNKEYKDKWYFIILDQRYKYFYSKYGKSLSRSLFLKKITELTQSNIHTNNGKSLSFETQENMSQSTNTQNLIQ